MKRLTGILYIFLIAAALSALSAVSAISIRSDTKKHKNVETHASYKVASQLEPVYQAAHDLAVKSMIQVEYSMFDFSHSAPWTTQRWTYPGSSSTIVGVAIEGKRIVVPSRVAANSIRLLVWPASDDTKRYEATIEASGSQRIALLNVADAEFWAKVKMANVGVATTDDAIAVPAVGDTVLTIRYNGDNKVASQMTIDGVSFKNPTWYTRTLTDPMLPVYQTAGSGSWTETGAMFDKEGKCVLGFLLDSNGDAKPWVTHTALKRFIQGVEKFGEDFELADLNVETQTMENPSLKKHFGLTSDLHFNGVEGINPTGLRVRRADKIVVLTDAGIPKNGKKMAEHVLKKDDIILAINNLDVSDRGMIKISPYTEPVPYTAYMFMRFPGDKVPILILRDKEVMTVTATLSFSSYIMSIAEYQRVHPRYVCYGGFTFVPLTWGLYDEVRNLPTAVVAEASDPHRREFVDQEMVVFTNCLSSEISVGYDTSKKVVTSVNGQKVKNLKHLAEIFDGRGIEKNGSEFFKIEFVRGAHIIIEKSEAERIMPEIMKREGMKSARQLEFNRH